MDSISHPSDLKKLSKDQLPQLCAEIREFFIAKILKNGGHFSANLGVVELTVALHYVYELSSDKLVWDVGHQSYIHKLLTGRKSEFDTIRKLDGLSGFPKMDESDFDHFGTGHSSTSISAVMGMAEGALLNNKENKHIAVIGDGSLTGGMAFEALNNLGVSKANVLVIVNDNQMGIDPNLGAINNHLAEIDGINPNLFENLGLPYYGPVDGNDILELVNIFEKQKLENGPKVIHIKTLKGKGYEPAEKAQTDWHSVSYVKIDPLKSETMDVKPVKFQEVFGHTLLELAEKDERVVGITPAMPSGSSMKIMMEAMPHRVFDVGIAEQHAVTFAAGLALEGKRPFCNIYSTFAQRAYDQIIHDVALQNIPVIFCLDRAGLVGADGPTHHGTFDLSFLNAIPNLTILSPMDEQELRNMMYWAVDYVDGPIVIRYPRGRGNHIDYKNEIKSLTIPSSRMLTTGQNIAVISIGQIGTEVQNAITQNSLEDKVTHIDARCMKPLNLNMLGEVFRRFDKIITVEESCLMGGFGQQVKGLALNSHYKGTITSLGLPDVFVEHGEINELRAKFGIDADAIGKVIGRLLGS
ncbi:1-deoxy-D-xylulose-5-phosphate synthase [Bacteroidia bacterium]|nr:1-deoxy-D-xylulose-5-phosphate synthase [Bacteroidia bacterium]MDB4106995.1 1-deoxy-D-xylulose-5-phosphate synthase [Bacteroidia bacterium]MDB9882455.1 1-deoxy-D-xylulose-5-phosphate synthase [Bacteroidia bacterium]